MEQKQTLEVVSILKKTYPNAKYYLDFSNPVELLVAAILSAQCRDEVVNACTRELFKKYKNAKDFADADLRIFINDIKTISFAGNKAKNIKEACKILVAKYNGKVPKSIEDLTNLPGIGRKTANTILLNAYGIMNGIPVDTHVIRISYRFGWTKSKNPDIIEKDLEKTIPEKEWEKISYILKAHGKVICQAPTPYCSKCPVNKLCPKNGVSKQL